MPRQFRLLIFVALVTAAAAVSGSAVWSDRMSFPGWWPLATFLLVATLLENLHTQLRVTAKGSLSFIMHLASALLFGAWWGAVVAGTSTLFGEIARSNSAIKILFNTSQRVLAVAIAAIAYRMLGGHLPPVYLESTAVLGSQAVQRDLGLFVIF